MYKMTKFPFKHQQFPRKKLSKFPIFPTMGMKQIVLPFQFHSYLWMFSYTLRTVHYAHDAANLNWGYSKYAKVACVHYFSTIALRTPHAVLTLARALRGVDSCARRVDSIVTWVILFCRVIFNDISSLVKSLIYHIKKKKRCVYVVYELD